VFLGALKLDLQVLESRSLKEKRMVLRRIKDRVRDRLGVVVVEVGAQDLWQRAEVAVAVVSGDRGNLVALLDEARRSIATTEGIELLQEWREVSTFDGQSMDVTREAPVPGTEWTPPEWQRMLDEESR
jgi:uncharacterized protein